METVDLLVTGGMVITMDPQRRILRNGGVAIQDGRIAAVDRADVLTSRYRARQTIDAEGGLILPGLVDAHLHNIQQLSRGLADDVDLITWVYDRILPYEACMTPDDVYLSTLLSIAEMVRNGTTCACDPAGYHVDAIGRAYEETGMRGILSWAGMDQWPGDRSIPDAHPGKLGTAATLEAMERTVKTWHGAAGGRIRASYALRTEPNISPELFRETKRLADRDGVFIHIHAAVSQSQVEWMRRHTGHTNIRYLEHLGVLDSNWLLAHVAAVDDGEVELLARRNVKIAHQPGACLHGTYGAVARGRIPEMLAAGITVGMGCDANSANNSLDMFRTMYLVATVHKEARQDPKQIPPEKALEMATIDSARAIHWQDEIGSLEPGKRGDVIVVDTRRSNWVPTHEFSAVPNLVYSGDGRDVRTTIVEGRILMENGRLTTIDLDDVLERAQFAAERILERLPYRLEPAWPVVD